MTDYTADITRWIFTCCRNVTFVSVPFLFRFIYCCQLHVESYDVLSTFLFYIEYRKLSRGVTFFIRVNSLAEILSGFYPVLELWRVRESIRDTVSADKDVLVDSFSSLLLSFGGNLSFLSVFLSTVALILLLMQFFRLSYVLHYLI